MSAVATPPKTSKRASLLAQHAELIAKRKDLIAQADGLKTRAETDPVTQGQLAGIVQQLNDQESRIKALEAEIAADPEEDTPPADPPPSTPRNTPIPNELRTQPPIPTVPQIQQPSTPPPPAYVRDLGDKRAIRTRDYALRAWALAPSGKVPDEFRAAANELRLDLHQRAFSINLLQKQPRKADVRNRTRMDELVAESRALGTTSVGVGGALVPTDLVRDLEMSMLYVCPLREKAQVLRTTGGNPMKWPCLDDTANKGEIIGENAVHNQQDLAFTQKALGAFQYSSKIILIPYQLFQDTAIAVEPIIGKALGERLGRIQQDHFAVGAGTTEPFGFVTQAGTGPTTAATLTIGTGDLIELEHSVDPAYRDDCEWFMHDSIFKGLRKLVDSTGRPIFQRDYIEGSQGTVLGRKVNIVNSMTTSLAAGAKPIVIADPSKILIRDAMDVEVLRSDERYFEYGQTAYVAHMRSDSLVLNTGAVKCLVMKT